MNPYTVKVIERKDCEEYTLEIHYAKRWCGITYKFGLFKYDVLCGIITYGTPFSSTVRTGLAGRDNAKHVLELNRLCLRNNEKNEASILIGRSLKLLPDKSIIISYADSSKNHVGYVYQATNFDYYGLTAKRTDWALKSRPELHGQTISDQFEMAASRVEAAREFYGDDFYLKPRSRKHRYIILKGSKSWKKIIKEKIRYSREEYPKC